MGDHRPGLRGGLGPAADPAERTGKRVAVIGSGPAGLAAAQQLTRAGHDVTVYERADRIGGLLRYGIPEFKMEKAVLDRRLDQMRAEGTRFVTGVEVGGPREEDLSTEQLRAEFDAVVLAGGATVGRDLPAPGRELAGIHLAMEYLPYGNLQALGELDAPPIDAHGKHVVIIGGGDTGADCLGTAHRQGPRRSPSWRSCPHRRAAGPRTSTPGRRTR
ncbi:FAD-dependent oxidoreductase [Blastococcus brunescens]|uniref:FAD-dependent oxidoreductase n=1 Tax=Blastococcus brunescens TaxID=1564165 RepID=A0ABZ1B817_9ACTN|nr:FAD-dependent oxidoreductase [Blastococcus sp. BMG 8361]WRL66954.1 FAD-dependent oxidoreductase [Blastococcus sp. BMG 8361]